MFGFKKKSAEPAYLDIPSLISGKIVSLADVEDEAFSSKAMGEGFAVVPDIGKVIAPFEGTIAHIMEKSKHAMLIEHSSGVQILVHVGMNTVSLKGEGFTAHVASGDKVKKGQLLLEFDIDYIRQAGYSVVTPIVVPAGQEIIKRIEELEVPQNAQEEAVLRVHY